LQTEEKGGEGFFPDQEALLASFYVFLTKEIAESNKETSE